MYVWCQKCNKKPIETSKEECDKASCQGCLSMNVVHELTDYEPSFRNIKDYISK